MSIDEIFAKLPQRYIPGKIGKATTYYFSIGDKHRYTVHLDATSCRVEQGKSENADVILKTTPELFEKMVIKGKMPGPIDLATGKVKTNDPLALKQVRDYFDLSGL